MIWRNIMWNLLLLVAVVYLACSCSGWFLLLLVLLKGIDER